MRKDFSKENDISFFTDWANGLKGKEIQWELGPGRSKRKYVEGKRWL